MCGHTEGPPFLEVLGEGLVFVYGLALCGCVILFHGIMAPLSTIHCKTTQLINKTKFFLD